MERDDLIVNDQYSLDAHHSEEEGVQKRKTIWKVAALLSVITIFEVFLGIYVTDRTTITWEIVKWTFIALTLFKAGYIVLSFMHLGDERPAFKWMVLAPYLFFIVYLVYLLLLLEADYIRDVFGGLVWW